MFGPYDMVQYYDSGYITFRSRKIGIIFSGETAEHIMDNYVKENKVHPLKHIRIQQLAKKVLEWKTESSKRFSGTITDNKTGHRYRVVIEIYFKFAIIITCYKY